MIDIPKHQELETTSGYRRLLTGGDNRVKTVQDELESKVFGQTQACESLARTVTRAQIGMSDKNRPKGVFFFLGPSGVGKTELTKALAQVLYKDNWEKHYVYVDCTALAEPHAVSRLKGSDPNYVGYGDKTLLDPAQISNGAVICFDEVEKAHRSTHRFLLPVLESGKTTVYVPDEDKNRKQTNQNAAKPIEIDFTNSYIIMTSNVGAKDIARAQTGRTSIGFSPKSVDTDIKEAGLNALKEYFSDIPEFLNRFGSSNTICFQDLDDKGLKLVFRKFITEFNLQQQDTSKYSLTVDDSILDFFLGESSPSQKIGARELRAQFEDKIVTQVAEAVYVNNVPQGSDIRVLLEQGVVAFYAKDAPAKSVETNAKTISEVAVNQPSSSTNFVEISRFSEDVDPKQRAKLEKGHRRLAHQRISRLISKLDNMHQGNKKPTIEEMVRTIQSFYDNI